MYSLCIEFSDTFGVSHKLTFVSHLETTEFQSFMKLLPETEFGTLLETSNAFLSLCI